MLGKLEEIAMLGVIQARAEATAANVYKAVADGGITSSFGALFTTLDRLEDKGFLSSELRMVETGTGRKDRKVYELTGLGEKALRESLNKTRGLIQASGWAMA